MKSFPELNQAIISCQRCPRLVAYCARVAQEKRAAYTDQTYWGRPVPGFGDPQAWLWIIGLAPGAHGANRTGRMFTGDRSGDFLYAALHRAGWANQPSSRSADDGLQLTGVYISAAGRCAPPENKPRPEELLACQPYLSAELQLLNRVRAILALGRIAFDAALRTLSDGGYKLPNSHPQFTHGGQWQVGPYLLAASYHVSQQNTFTGRLTSEMFDEVLAVLSRK